MSQKETSAEVLYAPKSDISTRSRSLIDQLKNGRSGSEARNPKHKPNCLFLNHLGTRRVSKVALKAAACEAVLEIESSAFDHPDCSFRIPEEILCPMKYDDWASPKQVSTEMRQSLGQHSRSSSACSLGNDYETIAMPYKCKSGSEGSISIHRKDTERPRATLNDVDTFIGIPKHNHSLPAMNSALDQLSGYPSEVPPDIAPQDFDYPSESPVRRPNVIQLVGPPTDLFVDQTIVDPDAAGIGFAIPPFPAAGPSKKRSPFEKRVSVRKRRSPVVKTSGYPNAFNSPHVRRRVSYSVSTPQRYFPRTEASPGLTPAPPMTTAYTYRPHPATVSPDQPPRTSTKLSRCHDYETAASPRLALSSTRGPPYRRQAGVGLSPMPYGLAPPLVSSRSRRVRFSSPY